MRLIPVLLLALICSACVARPEAERAPTPTSQLYVERVQPGGPFAEEGSVSFARIERVSGSVVTEEGFDAPDHGAAAGNYGYPDQLELDLEPGTYTLISYQRACDPTCDNLDPSSRQYTCQRPIKVEEGTSLTVRVTMGHSGCTIDLSVITP